MVAEARRVCRELSAQALRSFARDLFLPLRTAAAKLSTNPKNLDNKAQRLSVAMPWHSAWNDYFTLADVTTKLITFQRL
jgi:hypothetical protein